MSRLLPALLSLGLALPSLPVGAADPPPKPIANPTDADTARAKELFENGSELYNEGTYDAAIAAFRESYQLSGDPILLYNIYQCYDRLGDYDAAIEYVEHYRAFAPASERDALTEKVEGLRRRKLRDEATAEERAEPDADEGGGSRAPAKVTSVDQPSQKIYTPVAIAFTAITAAAVGVGIGLGVASSNRKSDANDQCEGDPLICPMAAQSDVDASRKMGIGANVSFAIAGAAAIVVITVIAVNASKRRRLNREAKASRARLATTGGALQLKF